MPPITARGKIEATLTILTIASAVGWSDRLALGTFERIVIN